MTISTFILAIALVESGNDPTAVGKHGERSAYQFTERTWRAYTTVPFTKTNTRRIELTRRIAQRHAHTLEQRVNGNWGSEIRVILNKIPRVERETVLICAAGWHRGEAYMRRPVSRWSDETRDYADRVWNVYQDLKRKEGK